MRIVMFGKQGHAQSDYLETFKQRLISFGFRGYRLLIHLHGDGTMLGDQPLAAGVLRRTRASEAGA